VHLIVMAIAPAGIKKAPKRWYRTTFSQKKAQIKHKIHIKR
jgi:hypothetical protein